MGRKESNQTNKQGNQEVPFQSVSSVSYYILHMYPH